MESELWDNGSYQRLIPTAPGQAVPGIVFRKLCPQCMTSFSLHPEFLLKRQRYSLALVAAWLWSFLKNGTSSRCQEFYRKQGVVLPNLDPLLSWTDSLDLSGERTRPGYQTLHYWSKMFCHRAELLREELVAASQTLDICQSPSWSVPVKARSLQLCWLRWEMLCRSRETTPSEPEMAFQKLVRTLAKAPSHKARREPARQDLYDVLII